jgi:hypothetical protein
VWSISHKEKEIMLATLIGVSTILLSSSVTILLVFLATS